MENIELQKFFSQENVKKYSVHFNTPKVIEQANKIVDAVRNTKELSNDENIAGFILAGLILNRTR